MVYQPKSYRKFLATQTASGIAVVNFNNKTLESIESWIIQWRANLYDSEEVLMNIKMLLEQQ